MGKQLNYSYLWVITFTIPAPCPCSFKMLCVAKLDKRKRLTSLVALPRAVIVGLVRLNEKGAQYHFLAGSTPATKRISWV